MTWLTPALAGIAAAVAVPALLILYFLKLRRRDVEVSTTLLWKKSIQDLQANAPFQRLRRNILLVLQLFALAAALVALGQPLLMADQAVGMRHIILIDRSASMQTLDEPGPGGQPRSRLDAAKAQAIEFVESLRDPSVFDRATGDQALLITFDSSARMVENFTGDKARLRRAIEAITPADTPTSISLAVQLAKAQSPVRLHVDRDGSVRRIEGMIQDETPHVIQVWSDGRIPDAEEANPGVGETIVFNRVGRPDTGNIALVGLRAERAFDDPRRLSIFTAVESTHADERSIDVELLIDGRVAMIRPVTLPPAVSAGSARADRPGPGGEPASPVAARRTPSSGGVVFSLEREEGALVQVRLRSGPNELTDDPLDVDNRGWLVVPAARQLSVALVSRGSLFLTTALEGMPLSRLSELTPEQFELALSQGKHTEHDVIILDGWSPPAPQDGAAPAAEGQPAPRPAVGLPPGRFLVFGAVPGAGSSAQLVDEGPTEGGQGVIDWRRDHPALRGLVLDGILIGDARRIKPLDGGGAAVIASGDRGPLIADVSDEKSRALVVAFRPVNSNWPLQWSWVVFVAQAVSYLGDDLSATGESPGMVQPGGVIRDRVDPRALGVEVRSAEGPPASVEPAADGSIVFGPVERVGPYRLSWEGPPGPNDQREGDRAFRLIAANLLDPAESDVASPENLTLATQAVAATDQSESRTRRLWPWLLLAACAIIMLEWFVYNRKVHV
jgi:hypothetical protein